MLKERWTKSEQLQNIKKDKLEWETVNKLTRKKGTNKGGIKAKIQRTVSRSGRIIF